MPVPSGQRGLQGTGQQWGSGATQGRNQGLNGAWCKLEPNKPNTPSPVALHCSGRSMKSWTWLIGEPSLADRPCAVPVTAAALHLALEQRMQSARSLARERRTHSCPVRPLKGLFGHCISVGTGLGPNPDLPPTDRGRKAIGGARPSALNPTQRRLGTWQHMDRQPGRLAAGEICSRRACPTYDLPACRALAVEMHQLPSHKLAAIVGVIESSCTYAQEKRKDRSWLLELLRQGRPR